FAKLLRMDHEGIEPVGREATVRAELERIGDRFAAWRGASEQDQIAGAVHPEQIARVDGGERVADLMRQLQRILRSIELQPPVAASPPPARPNATGSEPAVRPSASKCSPIDSPSTSSAGRVAVCP